MLFDSYGRKINYLRVSVTDKCNYACKYCRPEEGVTLKKHEEILSLEKIHEIVKAYVASGIDKVRITGGEPLVRKNIVYLIQLISSIPGIKDLCMTTNGSLLPHYAYKLKAAGLQRLNISLDTLVPEKFSYLTRGGKLADVIEGIHTAKKARFTTIKINTVVIKDFNENELDDLTQFAKKNGLEIRFIKEMNLKTGQRYIIENANAGQCELCNRLRLTCDGKLKPCLFSDYEVNIGELTMTEALDQAVQNKPKCGTYNSNDCMVQIGG
ncbi:MAG: radical SAM protein [Candidatus Margulisiibacteriota bacterium]|nr:MAG: hypothetical protein A2X43_04960 [Candidatus Margulisbacteria bacterium GWD2_39_127]PZM78139.1 MAG: radical SAM protein [Candidatus Margulisiibacteriota bacterium]HAR64379.1 radical SAM protein [Candidatus Margulisiibacteriota bacterium]HCY37920.1 radical SAM protein [Candidatus Margulisiibacteriota bacterium]